MQLALRLSILPILMFPDFPANGAVKAAGCGLVGRGVAWRGEAGRKATLVQTGDKDDKSHDC